MSYGYHGNTTKVENRTLEKEEQRWLENFQVARRVICSSLLAGRKEFAKLSQEAKDLQVCRRKT